VQRIQVALTLAAELASGAVFTPVPTVLAGKYRLIGELGRGGMGTVWRAEHLTLRSHVAIKLLGAEIARYPEALERFLLEAQAAAALRSPHVVQVLDYGEDHGVAFIAMELLEGESLGARLRRTSQLPPAETARLLGHVARALQRAHEANIVHRDLKPDNIFIVKDQEEELAKVLDFGIAKAGNINSNHQTRGGIRLGTPDYMSPEQVSASSALDYRADLWAFGVIAFECLTGKHPFERETPEQLFYAICSAPLPVPSQHGPVPRGFDAWFARACAKEPAQRFNSAQEAAAELNKACGTPVAAARGATQVGKAVPVKAPKPVKPAKAAKRGAWQSKSRRRFWIGLAIAAALVVVVEAVFFFDQHKLREFFASPSVTAQPSAPPPAAPKPPAPHNDVSVTPVPDQSAPPLQPEPIGQPLPAPREAPPAPPERDPDDSESKASEPIVADNGLVPASAVQCFKACDVPARDCERSCKSPACNVAATCFRAEAECDLGCYRKTVERFASKPPTPCAATCQQLDHRCRTRTCGGSAICAKERCEPVRKDCERSCSSGHD
jgi:eukaryotic-like serine/threonine-protein kinase